MELEYFVLFSGKGSSEDELEGVLSSIQDQAEEGIRAAQQGAQQVIDQIPPDAWPMIDLMFKITIALALAWLFLSLIGWWRRRAYNLTVASTAKGSSKDELEGVLSSIQDQAEEGIRAAQQGAQQVIDQIPPDAWPMIDLMFKITMSLALVWLFLSLIGWWRRRAYNLTVASTAKRNKKAEPGFLSVDEKARKDAINRGRGHEETLTEREADEALATLKAAKEPITWASRIASAATFVMSLFTLLTGFSGAIFGVKRLGGYVEDATTAGQIEYLLREHTIGCAVVAFVIGYHIWRFIAEEKWKKA